MVRNLLPLALLLTACPKAQPLTLVDGEWEATWRPLTADLLFHSTQVDESLTPQGEWVPMRTTAAVMRQKHVAKGGEQWVELQGGEVLAGIPSGDTPMHQVQDVMLEQTLMAQVDFVQSVDGAVRLADASDLAAVRDAMRAELQPLVDSGDLGAEEVEAITGALEDSAFVAGVQANFAGGPYRLHGKTWKLNEWLPMMPTGEMEYRFTPLGMQPVISQRITPMDACPEHWNPAATCVRLEARAVSEPDPAELEGADVKVLFTETHVVDAWHLATVSKEVVFDVQVRFTAEEPLQGSRSTTSNRYEWVTEE